MTNRKSLIDLWVSLGYVLTSQPTYKSLIVNHKAEIDQLMGDNGTPLTQKSYTRDKTWSNSVLEMVPTSDEDVIRTFEELKILTDGLVDMDTIDKEHRYAVRNAVIKTVFSAESDLSIAFIEAMYKTGYKYAQPDYTGVKNKFNSIELTKTKLGSAYPPVDIIMPKVWNVYERNLHVNVGAPIGDFVGECVYPGIKRNNNTLVKAHVTLAVDKPKKEDILIAGDLFLQCIKKMYGFYYGIAMGKNSGLIVSIIKASFFNGSDAKTLSIDIERALETTVQHDLDGMQEVLDRAAGHYKVMESQPSAFFEPALGTNFSKTNHALLPQMLETTGTIDLCIYPGIRWDNTILKQPTVRVANIRKPVVAQKIERILQDSGYQLEWAPMSNDKPELPQLAEAIKTGNGDVSVIKRAINNDNTYVLLLKRKGQILVKAVYHDRSKSAPEAKSVTTKTINSLNGYNAYQMNKKGALGDKNMFTLKEAREALHEGLFLENMVRLTDIKWYFVALTVAYGFCGPAAPPKYIGLSSRIVYNKPLVGEMVTYAPQISSDDSSITYMFDMLRVSDEHFCAFQNKTSKGTVYTMDKRLMPVRGTSENQASDYTLEQYVLPESRTMREYIGKTARFLHIGKMFDADTGFAVFHDKANSYNLTDDVVPSTRQRTRL